MFILLSGYVGCRQHNALEWVTCPRLSMDRVECLLCYDVWFLLQLIAMPPRRRASTRAHPASDEEPEQREAEQTEQSEIRVLWAQVAQMSEAMRRQDENMDRMMRLFEHRVSPAASPIVTSPITTLIVPLTEERRDLTNRLTHFSHFHPP